MPASAPPFVITRLVGKDIAAKSLSLTGGTITANTPVIDNTITWNNGAVAFTGIKLNVTDTASAAASVLLDLQVGGSSRWNISKSGKVTQTDDLELGGSARLAFGADTIIRRDAANVLAQRNSTNAQTIRIYNTYTDASNYERLAIDWATSANLLRIETQAAGTGVTTRSILLRTGGSASLIFGTNSTSRWEINSSGHLISGAATDNTYDIGASGATRPRHVYVGTNVAAGGNVSAGNTSGFATGRMLLNTPDNNGVVKIGNAAGTDFDRLQFGGTTSSFPALKRSTTILQARLADDSAFAPIQGIHRTHNNAVAETPTATHTIEIQDASGTIYKVLAVAA